MEVFSEADVATSVVSHVDDEFGDTFSLEAADRVCHILLELIIISQQMTSEYQPKYLRTAWRSNLIIVSRREAPDHQLLVNQRQIHSRSSNELTTPVSLWFPGNTYALTTSPTTTEGAVGWYCVGSPTA